jgi:hypothetical protein
VKAESNRVEGKDPGAFLGKKGRFKNVPERNAWLNKQPKKKMRGQII